MAATVTAAVLLGVVALSAWVLGIGYPSPGQATNRATPAISASPATDITCHPIDVVPFECGTYRSVYGAESVTGDTGGPAKDPLTISFTRSSSGLLLRAVSPHCFEAAIPVKTAGSRPGSMRIIRTGEATYSEGACHARGADRRNWAYRFLNGPLEFDTGGGGLVFNMRTAMVTFEYLGVTPLGQTPLARNDLTCVPAHVAPFSCGRYRSVSGTGALAFLAQHPYKLWFNHLNGELTAGLAGDCNAFSAALEPDGDTILAMGGAMTAMGCSHDREARDDALVRFLHGTLTYRIDGDTLTLSSGTATAVFQHG